jgi:putative membrane protein
MSTTTATGLRITPARPRPAVVGAVLTVLAEIAWPLLSGHPRDVLTAVTVVLFCVTVLLDAGHGRRLTLLCVAGSFGYAVEVLGVHTGVPFGHYRYTATLGPRLAGVPLVIPLAWTMMAWPSLCVGRRLAGSRVAVALLGGVALASWDLFLDPQMTRAGHWHWTGPGPWLNGIPLLNHLGWLSCAVLLVALLDRVTTKPEDDRVSILLWLWTFASSILANAAFFGRPAVALAGGIGMGVVAVPLLVRLVRG